MARLNDQQLKERSWYEQKPYGGFWERGYEDREVSTLGGASREVIELAPGLPSGARVLDLGCGEGRNALYLASRGFDVTAIDRSESAISKLRYVGERAEVELAAHVADVATLELEDTYDLVMAHGLLHYLSNAEWRELLTKVKAQTLPGGFNVYTIKYFNEEYPRPHEFQVARFTSSLEPDELRNFYADWKIVRYDVYAKWDRHPGLATHCHPVEKLVAHKPGTADSVPYVEEAVPVGQNNLPEDVFAKLDVGMTEGEVWQLCGQPEVVDVVTAEGVQYGAFDVLAPDGYVLHQCYYGRTMLEIVDGKLRAKNKYKTPPVRIWFTPPYSPL